MRSISRIQASRFAAPPDQAFEHQLGVAAVGSPVSGLDRADAEHGVSVAAAGLVQRILLTTDGTVVRILESYAGESIVAVRLEQSTTHGGEPSHALELRADHNRLTRCVLLRTSTHGRALLYAETLAALDHPLVVEHRPVLDELIQTDRRPVSHAASWITAPRGRKPRPRTMRASGEMAAGDTILTGTPHSDTPPQPSSWSVVDLQVLDGALTIGRGRQRVPDW